jgi:hypothetical protein
MFIYVYFRRRQSVYFLSAHSATESRALFCGDVLLNLTRVRDKLCSRTHRHQRASHLSPAVFRENTSLLSPRRREMAGGARKVKKDPPGGFSPRLIKSLTRFQVNFMHVPTGPPTRRQVNFFHEHFLMRPPRIYLVRAYHPVMGREGPEINLDIKKSSLVGIKKCVHNIPFEITA